MTPEKLARKFHEIYERLAPNFGYDTRPETRCFNPESKNGKLMVAVCDEVLTLIFSRYRKPTEQTAEEPIIHKTTDIDMYQHDSHFTYCRINVHKKDVHTMWKYVSCPDCLKRKDERYCNGKFYPVRPPADQTEGKV